MTRLRLKGLTCLPQNLLFNLLKGQGLTLYLKPQGSLSSFPYQGYLNLIVTALCLWEDSVEKNRLGLLKPLKLSHAEPRHGQAKQTRKEEL